MTVATKAATLRALHRPGDPLILPNAWDAASARVVEAGGFPAVATSSAAVAGVLGYADGEATPVDEMLNAVARIARAVSTPVTADLERGYGMAPTELVERLAATGAVGCNLEDSDPATGTLIDANQQADFLAAVRDAIRDARVDLVINARVDTYLHGTGPPSESLAEAIRRARLYVQAGADCVYPILATEPDAIRVLVEQAGGPVNILFRAGTPSMADLAGLGVARVSFGSGLHRVMQANLAQLVTQIGEGRNPYSEEL
jgi:2-methylisocitrate lyase-like PEP mutase family enzyme